MTTPSRVDRILAMLDDNETQSTTEPMIAGVTAQCWRCFGPPGDGASGVCDKCREILLAEIPPDTETPAATALAAHAPAATAYTARAWGGPLDGQTISATHGTMNAMDTSSREAVAWWTTPLADTGPLRMTRYDLKRFAAAIPGWHNPHRYRTPDSTVEYDIVTHTTTITTNVWIPDTDPDVMRRIQAGANAVIALATINRPPPPPANIDGSVRAVMAQLADAFGHTFHAMADAMERVMRSGAIDAYLAATTQPRGRATADPNARYIRGLPAPPIPQCHHGNPRPTCRDCATQRP